MKKIYILLMLIIASIQFVEAQLVFPSTEQKPVWEVVQNQLHSELYYELLIQVEKDTILCGENYSKVIATYKHNNPDTLVFGFYRQAERKVLFRVFGESCQSFDEYLIYDFEAEIGDTITVGWNQIAIVTAIENLKLGNVERRAIGVQYYQQEFGSPIAEEWWIEGIGGSKYPFLQPFCSLYSCYESSYVSCMRAMDKVLLSVGNESCPYDTIAQSVFPTYEENPVWCVEESIFGRPYETYHIELKADTFICGKTYTPVWEHNRPLFGGGFTSGVTGYIRQEGQRVYHTYQGCAEEILLYDFSLQKGDTIYYSQQYKSQFGIISKIDTIEYSGVFRKTMTVDYPQLFPFPMLPIQRIWIEGIGDTFHPFNSVGCLAGNCEFNARLACFSANNGILYGNCTAACGIDSLTSADDILLNKNQLRLLNNPVALNQLLNITSDLQESTEGQLYIYNALGQVLSSQKLRLAFAGERLPLSWSPSAPGVYWLAWQSEGGERQTVQFVVQ